MLPPRPPTHLCQSSHRPYNLDHNYERKEQRSDVAQVPKEWDGNAVKAEPAQDNVQPHPKCAPQDHRALRLKCGRVGDPAIGARMPENTVVRGDRSETPLTDSLHLMG